MKRVGTILLVLAVLLCSLPASYTTAAEKETILLAGSDFQTSNHSTQNVENVLNTLAIHGINKADGAFFCGDYTLESVDENQGQSTRGVSVLKRLFTPIVGNHMTFVQGNHDPEDTVGLSKAGNNDPVSMKYGAYVIHEDQYLQYNWDYSGDVVKKTAADLKKYLDEKVRAGWNKPIFVLSHVGLHWGNRTIKEGSAIHGRMLVDVLNEAAEKGLNIIFLFGHDHSGGVADFMGGGAIYLKKGDKMEVCTGEKKGHEPCTIKFTYMNAGYIGYYSTTEASCDNAVTMSVFRIKGNEVIITRYDGYVNLGKQQYGIHNLKSAGVWHPDYSKEGHAVPDTRVYASSRKVTANGDVPIDTPMPQATTTSMKTTEKTNGSGVAVQKPTADRNTTAAKEQSIQAPTTSGDKESTDSDGSAIEDTEADENLISDPTGIDGSAQTTDSGMSGDGTPVGGAGIPGWVWVFPIAGGAVLLGSVIVVIITAIKKKEK